MHDRLDRLWRIGGQGVAFASFGLGGGLLAITIFPLLTLLAPAADQAQQSVRYIIHLVFRLFLWCVLRLKVIDLVVEGRERLADCRGCIIVSNHPTLLDVVILMSLVKRVQCVVKHQLWRNFFLRGVVSSAGFIRNDLSTETLLERCTEEFSRGENLLIFPEGTRTTPGVHPKFMRGFANVAILCRSDIQIVVITCDPITLTRGQPWYSVPLRRPCFKVRVTERWGMGDYSPTPHRALNARRLVRDLEMYYQKELAGNSGE